MFLIICIFLGIHRIEQVAFDVKVGVGCLVEHLGVFERRHTLLDGVVLLVGLHLQIGIAIEGRNAKQEATVLSLLRRANKILTYCHLGLYQHLFTHWLMVRTQIIVSVLNPVEDKLCGSDVFRIR